MKYVLFFTLFSIIYKDRGGFVYPSGCKPVGIILIVCFERGDVKVWFLSGHGEAQFAFEVVCIIIIC